MSALLQVLQAEAFKLARKRRMWVLIGLWWGIFPAVLLIGGYLVTANLEFILQEFGTGSAETVSLFASPFGMARLAIAGPTYLSPTLYVIAVAAIAAVLIGDERSHNMWKTVLTLQPSRLSVLVGKFLLAQLALGALMLGAVLAGTLLGALGMSFLPTTFAGEWGTLLPLFLRQWLFATALTAFAFLMLYLTRNLAIGVILIFFLPSLLETLYTIYATVVGFQPINRFNLFLQSIRLRQVFEDLPSYFFTTNLYAPSRAQLGNLTDAVFQSEGFELGQILGVGMSLERAAWVMAGYTLLFGAILAWRFVRSDVD